MGRLIPLKLQPIPTANYKPPTSPPTKPLPPIPAKSSRHAKPKMPLSLPLPSTPKEWRAVLDEVRTTYLRGQYKQCSARCIQLLEGSPDTFPSLHRIYLSFYAAICLELTARPLPIDASQKLSLINLARDYYQKAEHYMFEAESEYTTTYIESMKRTPRTLHRQFSLSSSDSTEISPRSSVTLAQSSPPSAHSPASSVCSTLSNTEDESYNLLKPQPLRVKKKASHKSFPKLTPSDSIDRGNCLKTHKEFSSGFDDSSSQPDSLSLTTVSPLDGVRSDSASSFLLSHSITRYNSHLSTLRTQLTRHLSIIGELVESIQTTQCCSSITKSKIIDCKTSRCKTPAKLGENKRFTIPDIIESEQEEKARQRNARIAELKQRGVEWRLGNGRFDGSKYERLCQDALRELPCL